MFRIGFAFVLVCLVVAPSAFASDESVADVFERVESSVVTLHVTADTGVRNRDGDAVTEGGTGSGVLLENGQIFTAAHVVHSADSVVVEYMDGTRVPAVVIGSVPQVDVALLRVDPSLPTGIRPAVLGDSDEVRIGSRCFIVGAPENLTHSLSVGYISARRSRDHAFIDLLDTEKFQTDAAMNPGNSGGPMFDMQGRVIGIASYGVTSTGQSVGLNFAVTSNTARRNLLDRNPIWSGMTEVLLTGDLADAFQLPKGKSGFLLQKVAKGSPADRLGLVGGSIPAMIGDTPLLLGGDIMLEAFGVELKSVGVGLQVMNALKDLKPNSLVSAKVLRNGEIVTLEAMASQIAPWLE